jgi:hypothetical protein
MENKTDLYSTLNRLLELEKIISKEKKEFGDKDVIEYNKLLRSINNVTPDDIIEYHNSILNLIFKKEERHEKDEAAYRADLLKCQKVLREFREVYSEKYQELAKKIKEIDELL